MADVRVNGRRVPPLETIDNMATLISKLENLANKNNSALTALSVNSSDIDIDNIEYHRMKLENEDTIDAKFDTSEQLSYESLQVALDMADLLIFDLKVSAIKIWGTEKDYDKTLESLLDDCNLFLTLAAKPLYLLNQKPQDLDVEPQNCLQELDRIASYIQDAIMLAVNGQNENACIVLVGRVKPAIERWIGLSAIFAQSLNINSDSNIPFVNDLFALESVS